MLTPNQIKCAVVMIGRANCTGVEAKEVASTLDALSELYAQMTAPPVSDEGDTEESDGDDS